MKNKYKHILFDVDGVLLDSFEAAIANINLLRQRSFGDLPQVATKNDLSILFSGPLRTSLRRFGLDDFRAKDFFDAHSSLMNDVNHSKPFLTIVEYIKNNLGGKCSIVSSAYYSVIERGIGHHLDTKLFSHILGRDDGRKKSEKISFIVDDLGYSLAEVLYVGDMVSDILYCKSIGVDVVCVGYGYHPAEYLSVFSPLHVLPSQADLVNFLNESVY